MEKLSRVKVASLLRNAGEKLRSLSKENKEHREKIAQLEKDAAYRAVAEKMENRGWGGSLSAEEKVSHVRKLDQEGKLEALRVAIDMSPGEPKLASLDTEAPVASTPTEGQGAVLLERFLMS